MPKPTKDPFKKLKTKLNLVVVLVILLVCVATVVVLIYYPATKGYIGTKAGASHYVWGTGSDDTGTGTPSNPYATIAYALSLAADGDAVVVRSGTYNLTASIEVPAGVTLRGPYGVKPNLARIVSDNTVSRTITLNARSRLFGLTLINQDASDGATPVFVNDDTIDSWDNAPQVFKNIFIVNDTSVGVNIHNG